MINTVDMVLSIEDITSIVNILFYVIIGISVFGFLVGLIKGVWKKGFSLIYNCGLILLVILFSKQIAEYLYTFDLTPLLTSINYELKVGETVVYNLGDFLELYVESFCTEAGIDITTSGGLDAVIGIVHMLLQFIIYIVGVIVVLVTGVILKPLLYHLIFKWFIPKTLRKKKKLRLIGGLVGFVEYAVIFSLALAPLTGVINTINQSVKDENGNINRNEANNNETYNLVMDIFEGYNNSILANTIMNITIDGKTLDVALMDYITNSSLGGESNVSLYEEIGELSSIVFDAIATGAVDMSAGTINLTILLESSFVKDAIYTLAESSLITTILPIGVSLAVSMSADSFDEFDLSSLDFSQVNWSDSLKSIGDVCDAILKTGLVTDALANPNEFMNSFVIDREHQENISTALREFGNSNIVNQLMPQLIVSYLDAQKVVEEEVVTVSKKNTLREGSENPENSGENEQPQIDIFGEVLSSLPDEAYSVDTYKSIQWGDELADMLGIVLDIADQFKSLDGNEVTLATITNLFAGDNLTKGLLGISETSSFESSEDYDNNPYVNGGTVNDIEIKGTKAILGCDDESKGLLDLQVLNKILVDFDVLPELVPTLFETFGDTIALDEEAVENLQTEMASWEEDDWKVELSSLIDSAVPLLNVSSILSQNQSEDSTALISNIAEGEGKTALLYFTDHMDSSYIISELIPSVAESMLSSESMDTELVLGLKLSDLNFTYFEGEETLSYHLKNIINNVLPEINNIMSLVSENTDIGSIIDKSDSLATLLEEIYKCKIINRDLKPEEELDPSIYTNFEKVMINLLTEVEGDINLPTMTDGLIKVEKETILGIDNWVSEGTTTGEIRSLFNVVSSLKSPVDEEGNATETEILYGFVTNPEATLNEDQIYQMGDEIRRIFTAIDGSILMKEALPSTLDKVIVDSGVSATLGDDVISFSEVTNWENEGEYFANTLDSIYEIKQGGEEGADLVNLIIECDSTLVKEYEFTEETNPEVINDTYYEYFVNNSKVYKLLNNVGLTESIDLAKLLKTAVNTVFEGNEELITQDELDQSMNDFDFETNNITYDGEYNVSWQNVNEEYHGEVYNISRVFAYSSVLMDFGNIDTISDSKISEMLDLVVKCYPLRSIVSPLINNAINQLDDGSSDSLTNKFIDASDFEYFERTKFDFDSTDLIVNRLDEVTLRLKEVKSISTLISEKDTLTSINDEDFENTIIDLTTIEDGSEDSKLTKLLYSLHDSEIFNSSLYISEVDESNNRNKLTAFETVFSEIFIMKPDLFTRQITNEDIFALNNKNEIDLWVKNETQDGEIYAFNNSINEIINSELYTKVMKDTTNTDQLTLLKELYATEQNHVSELSKSLEKSYFLEMQLPSIYDKYIFTTIKDNISTFGIDHPYILVENPYELYSLYEEIIWDDESSAIDTIVSTLAEDDISLENVSDISSTQISHFFDSLEQSRVLSYNSSTYNLNEVDDLERSLYEYTVCSFESYIQDEIFTYNIFDISDSIIDRVNENTTTLDIKDYNKEKNFIIEFIHVYDDLTIPNDENKQWVAYDKINRKFTFDSFNELDQEKITTLAYVLDLLYEDLSGSDVFNFRTLNNEGNYTKENELGQNDVLIRPVYEYAITHLSNQISTSIVDSFGFDESDGYVIDEELIDSSWDNTTLFHNEQDKLVSIINEYAKVVEIFKAPFTVSSISQNATAIEAFYEVFSMSNTMNHTRDHKGMCETLGRDDLSIYDDMVLYIINKVNTSLLDSLSITENNATIDLINHNHYLKDQTQYEEELSLSFDIITKVNEMNLDGATISFDIDYVNDSTNKQNLLDLLKLVEDSRCMNYPQFSGRYTQEKEDLSTFESVVSKIVAQDEFVNKIYDANNMMQNGTSGIEVVNNKIREISNNLVDNQNSYLDGVSYFNDDNTGEIDKLFNLFASISSNPSLTFTSLNEGKDYLIEVGNIYLIHDIVPNQIKSLSESTNIENASNQTTISSIDDAVIKNNPDYYYHEYVDETIEGNVTYSHRYPTFIECAQAYNDVIDDNGNITKKGEISIIIDLFETAKEANVGGEVKELGDLNNMFENLFVQLSKSYVFSPIAYDFVVRVLQNLDATINGQTISIDHFIDQNTFTTFTDENTKVDVVEANFDSYSNDKSLEELYRLEGSSLDNSIEYLISYVNYIEELMTNPLTAVKPQDLSYSDSYIGYVVYENYKTAFGI